MKTVTQWVFCHRTLKIFILFAAAALWVSLSVPAQAAAVEPGKDKQMEGPDPAPGPKETSPAQPAAEGREIPDESAKPTPETPAQPSPTSASTGTQPANRPAESRFDLPRTDADPSLADWPWGEPFEVIAKDGLILRGMYKAPREPRSTVVLFICGESNNYVESFRPLALRLGAKGYGVAAFDTRGVARSQKTFDGKTFNLRDHFNESDVYLAMIEDVKAIVLSLRREKDVRPFRTVLCGVSTGANVAIMAAAEMPLDVRSVIAISPGMDYHGLAPLSAAQSLGGRPLLAFSSGTDAYSYTFIQKLKRTVPEAKALSLGGGAHGHKLIDRELIETIAEWLDKN